MKYLNSNISRKILYGISGASVGFGVARILKDEGNLEKILDMAAIIIGGFMIKKLVNYENKIYFEKINKPEIK